MVASVQDMRPFRFEGHALTELHTGRVIPGLLFDFVWTRVSSIDDLWYVRVIGFSVVAITVILVQMWFLSVLKIRGGFAHLSMMIAGFLTLLLPSVIATTTWAQKATQLLAFPLAIGAGILATSERLNVTNWIKISLLIFLAAFTYQHFTTLAVLPTALWAALSYSPGRSPGVIRRVAVVAMLSGLALVVNYLFVQVLAPDVLERISNRSLTSRIRELADFIAKGIHLHVEKTPQAILVSFTLFLLILLTSLFTSRDKTVFRILLAIVFSIGCALIVSLASDGDSSYRAVFPIQITTWLGASCLVACCSRDRGFVRMSFFRHTPVLILFLSAAWLVGDARLTLHDRISLGNHRDWRDLVCTLSEMSRSESRDVINVRLAPVVASGPNGVFSEIGLQAKHVDWVFGDQVKLAIQSVPSLDSLKESRFEIFGADAAVPSRLSESEVIDLQQPCTERFAHP